MVTFTPFTFHYPSPTLTDPFFFKNSPPCAFLSLYFYFFFDDPMRFLPVGGSMGTLPVAKPHKKMFPSPHQWLVEKKSSQRGKASWVSPRSMRACEWAHPYPDLVQEVPAAMDSRVQRSGHIWKPPFYITAPFPLPMSCLWIHFLPEGEGKSYRQTHSAAFLCLILRASLKVPMQKYNSHLKGGKR